MEPWWKKWPGRLEFEIAELRREGIRYEFDSDAFASGSVVLRLAHKLNGQPIRLIARFPDLYPYFRFELYAPELDLPRHQNPFGEKNLCLIGRATANWNSMEDNVAKFLVEQFPKLVESAMGGDENLEEKQGEPVSEFYPFQGMVMIDSAWALDRDAKEGFLKVGMQDNSHVLRMAVIEVMDASEKTLLRAAPEIANLYHNQFRVRWVRSALPIKIGDPEKLFQHLSEAHPNLKHFSWKHDHWRKCDYDLIGITFPEEVRYREQGDGWIFIFIYGHRVKEGSKKRWKYEYLLAQAGRAGRSDMLERIPHLSFLGKKRVGIVGLGSIGAPSALEFARNGVGELRLLDGDYVDPSTAVRWPLGHLYACIRKPTALQYFISQNYPYTAVTAWEHRLGAVSSNKSQVLVLEEFLDGVDLLFDASAELGVHHVLSDFARERNIPYIVAFATFGAWGGIVARFIPERGCACWQCFERARTEGKLPQPPEDPEGLLQPAGCGNPTFTGASFDLQEIALTATRLAVSTLSKGQTAAGIPNANWNVAMLSLRDEKKPLLPQWEILNLSAYPGCACENPN